MVGTSQHQNKFEMKKVLLSFILMMMVVFSNAQIIVEGEITTNTTWTNENIYLLDGWVYVRAGATLTIEPGTIIKGDFDSKGALIIERDGKIIADGTAEQPIVFTSQRAAGQRSYGDWGGLIICGRASVNTPANAGNGTEQGEAIIEGGVGSIFGGGATPNDADSSGVLRYVRIEFGGIPFQPNSEINGLTMGGVGSKTVIDNVQVSYCGDDAFEWFGGTVNAKHLIAYRNWDDDFDTDFGYRGKIQFALSLRDPNIADQSGSNGFESDNDGSGTGNTPITQPIFSNVTILGPLAFNSSINSNYKRALHLRRNTRTSVFNSVFAGYPTGLLIDGSASHMNAMNNDLRFRNSVLAQFNDSIATSTNADPNNTTGAFGISPWYNTGAWSNNLINTISELMYNEVSLTNPDLTLMNGSPLASGAAFTDSFLNDDFFTSVNYRGAFGSDDWTSCWAEWDPQNEPYNGPINNAMSVTLTENGETEFCQGGSVMLEANASENDVNYLWSNGAITSTIEVSTTGTYSVQIMDSDRCSAESETMSVEVFENPVVSISADGSTSLCTGSTVTLTSDFANGNLWSTGATSQSILVDETGTYSVEYTDDNGCSSISNLINVSVSDAPTPTISTSGSTSICDGSAVSLESSSGESYVWYLNGTMLENADTQSLEVTEQGVYTVVVTNTDACDGVGESDGIAVFVLPAPIANAVTDLDISGTSVQFFNSSTNATGYLWDFGDGETSTDVNPIHVYDMGGNYTITLTAFNGNCTDEFQFDLASVSVYEWANGGTIGLYPNPTQGNLTIEISEANGSIYFVETYDAVGKMIDMYQINQALGHIQVQQDLSAYESGIYFVRVRTENTASPLMRVLLTK